MPDNNDQGANYPVDKETRETACKSQHEDNMDNPITDEEAQKVTDEVSASAARRQRRR